MAESDSSSYYLLRWSDHITNYTDMFLTLREEEEFVDCSIACYDGVVGAHRVVLAGCSSYLRDLLKRTSNPHPIIFLLEIPRKTVLLLMEFIYRGQAHIPHNQLRQLVTLGKAMKIKGLSKIHLPDNYDPMLPDIPRLHGLPDVNDNDRPSEYPSVSPDMIAPPSLTTEMASPTVQKNLPVIPTKTPSYSQKGTADIDPSFPQKGSAESDLNSPQEGFANSDPSLLENGSADFGSDTDNDDHDCSTTEANDESSQKKAADKNTEEENDKKSGTASESSTENTTETQKLNVPELSNTPSSKSRQDTSSNRPEVEKSASRLSSKRTVKPRKSNPSPASVSLGTDAPSSASSSNSGPKSSCTPKSKSKQTVSGKKEAKPTPTTQSKKRARNDSPAVVKKRKKDTNEKGKPKANKKKKEVKGKGKTKAKAPVYKTKASSSSGKPFHKWWYTIKRNQMEIGAYAFKHGIEASIRHGQRKYGVQVREKSIHKMLAIYNDHLKEQKKQKKQTKKAKKK